MGNKRVFQSLGKQSDLVSVTQLAVHHHPKSQLAMFLIPASIPWCVDTHIHKAEKFQTICLEGGFKGAQGLT